MKHRLIIIIFMTFWSVSIKAQMEFKNPSMQGNPCLSFCGPDDWTICNYYLTLDTTFYAIEPPHGPYDGLTYLFLEMEYDTPNYELGTISQKLPCSLRKSNTYKFSLQASSMWYLDYLHFGYLQVYAGNDSCSLTEMLWMSDLIDTVWTRQDIVFTPDSDYQWLALQPYDSTLPYPFTDIAIDALTPIYLINGNEVHVSSSTDTTIYLGNCLHLEANTANTTYDTLYWRDEATGSIISEGSWNTIVCPDSNTTYIIAMRDSVPDCAGYKWSYDTVKVTVLDTSTGIANNLKLMNQLILFPNPAKNGISVRYDAEQKDNADELEIKDILGQVVFRRKIQPSITYQIDVSIFTAGVYFASVVRDGNTVVAAKFVKE